MVGMIVRMFALREIALLYSGRRRYCCCGYWSLLFGKTGWERRRERERVFKRSFCSLRNGASKRVNLIRILSEDVDNTKCYYCQQ